MNIREIVKKYGEYEDYQEEIRLREFGLKKLERKLPNDFVAHFETNNKYRHWTLLSINYINPYNEDGGMPKVIIELGNIFYKPHYHLHESVRLEFRGVSDINIEGNVDLKSYTAHCNCIEQIIIGKDEDLWNFGCNFMFGLSIFFGFEKINFHMESFEQ